MTDIKHEEKQNASAQRDADACRQAFEEWFEPSGRGLERDRNGSYKFMTAYASWGAWQAGWEARAAMPEAEGQTA